MHVTAALYQPAPPWKIHEVTIHYVEHVCSRGISFDWQLGHGVITHNAICIAACRQSVCSTWDHKRKNDPTSAANSATVQHRGDLQPFAYLRCFAMARFFAVGWSPFLFRLALIYGPSSAAGLKACPAAFLSFLLRKKIAKSKVTFPTLFFSLSRESFDCAKTEPVEGTEVLWKHPSWVSLGSFSKMLINIEKVLWFFEKNVQCESDDGYGWHARTITRLSSSVRLLFVFYDCWLVLFSEPGN